MKTKHKTNQEILVYGYELLYKNLGPIGYTRFLQQMETGYGDYTKERSKWQKDYSIESVFSEITSHKKKSDLKKIAI